MKKIIIIGASGTIGKGIVEQLGLRHEVISVGRSSGQYQVKIEDPASVQALFEQVGKVDGVVVAAGDVHFGALQEMSAEQFQSGLNSKLMGQVNVALAALKHLNDGGSITLTNGVVAHKPRKGAAVNTAMAGAVEHLTRALAVDLAPVRVNAVCPGLVLTDVWHSIPEEERAEQIRRMTARVPLPRAGDPDEVAEAYLHLMRATYSTGQVLIVDGGMTLT